MWSTIEIKLHTDGLKSNSKSNLVTCEWTKITRNFTTLQSQAIFNSCSTFVASVSPLQLSITSNPRSQFTVYSLQFTVYSLQLTVNSLQLTVNSLQFTVHSSQFTVYSHTAGIRSCCPPVRTHASEHKNVRTRTPNMRAVRISQLTAAEPKCTTALQTFISASEATEISCLLKSYDRTIPRRRWCLNFCRLTH